MAPVTRRRRSSAGMPTIQMAVDHPEYTLNAERTPWFSRRWLPIVSIGLICVAAAALIYAWWLIRTAPTAAPLALPAPSVARVAPAASAMPNLAPAASVAAPALPSVAAVASVAAPVIQASAPAQPSVASQPSGVSCTAIAGMPVFTGATCIENGQEQDHGVTRLDNTYVTAATTDEVRRFFEQAFANGGWTVTKAARNAEDDSWQYTAIQGARRIKLDVDTDRGLNGVFTQIRIAEK